MEYKTSTDKSTPDNLANHVLFNVAGANRGLVIDHQIRKNADYICAVNEDKIAIIRKSNVKETAFVFYKMTTMGKGLSFKNVNVQFKSAAGYGYIFFTKCRNTI